MNMQERLIFLRSLKGLSEEQLGKELDIDPKRIKGFENGKTIYSDDLIKYAKYFNVTIDFIVRDTDDFVPKTTEDGEALSEEERAFIAFMRGFKTQGKLDLLKAIPKYVDESNRADAEELAEQVKDFILNQ